MGLSYLTLSLTIIFVMAIMHAEARAVSEPDAVAEADPGFKDILKIIGKAILPILKEIAPPLAGKLAEKLG